MNLGVLLGGKSGSVKLTLTFLAILVLATVYAAPEAPVTPLAHQSDVLAKPLFVRIKAVSLFEIDLTWRNRSQNEDGLQIERSKDKIHFRQIAQVFPGTTIFRDKNLFPGTRYYYRIRAFNSSGSSGYSTGSSRTPTPPRPLTVVSWGIQAPNATNALDYVSISEGFDHVLELNKDGSVVAFGNNSAGQCSPPPDLTNAVAIAAGFSYSLALKSDGTVVAFGDNSTGECSPPSGLSNVVAIAAGGRFALALKADGTVVGWGANEAGQATPPPDLNSVVAIAAGQEHSLALKSDGTVVGWGSPIADAIVTTNLTSVTVLAASFFTSFAVEDNGSVVAWGDNQYGVATPPPLTNVVAISASTDHALALTQDGNVVSWGNGDSYLYGTPDFGGGAVSVSTRGTERAALSLGPASPSDLSARVIAANRIGLSWRDNAQGEKGFLIERGTITVPGNSDWTQIGKVGANVTNFTDSSVTTNAPYRYRVRAYSPFGKSPYSAQVAVSLIPVAPEVNAVLGTNEVEVTWSDSAALFISFYFGFSTPYSGIDGFKIERALDNDGTPGAWTQVGSVDGHTFNFSDRTVQTNTIYWYRVTASNVAGDSPASTPTYVSVIPPFAPLNVFANLNITNGQSTISWSSNLTQPFAAGYKLEQAPDNNGTPGPWAQIADLPAFVSSLIVTNLSVNTTNWFRVRAYNWVGDSPYTDPITVAILPPVAPFSLSASMGINQNVQVIWYWYEQNDSLYPTGFSVERAPDINGSPGTWSEIAEVNNTTNFQQSFSDTNITVNTTYWYRVRAFSVLGFSDYAGPTNVSTVAPTNDVPKRLTAFITDGVSLFWFHNQGELVGFKIERALDNNGAPGAWTEIGSLTVSNYDLDLTFTDTNAVANATNWYRVRAYNWAGYSDYSTAASLAVVPPDAPYTIDALPYRNNVEVEWFPNDQQYESIEIQRAPDVSGVPGAWTIIAVTNGYTGGIFDTGLAANATYWYRVRAGNWVGYSAYTAPVSATIVAPSAPAGLEAQLGPTNTVSLTWSDLTLDEDGFKVERAPDNSGVPGNWVEIGTFYDTNAYTVNFSDTNATANTTNWYRVRAFNDIGLSDYSIPATIAIIPPAAPVSFVGFSYPDHIALSWTADYDTFSQGFAVERAPDVNGTPGAWTEITLSDDGSDRNVTANTIYWYHVRAYNWVGESPYTDAISASTTAP